VVEQVRIIGLAAVMQGVAAKMLLFADDSKSPICSYFVAFGGNVASAATPVGKLSTG
jgi:hypothetical protein